MRTQDNNTGAKPGTSTAVARASHHHRQSKSWASPGELAFLRAGGPGDARAVALRNLTLQPRHALRVGVPHAGAWYELLNSDAACYGGSGQGNLGRVLATDEPLADRPAPLALTLPPLAMLLLADRPFDPSTPSSGVPHARP